METNEQLSPRSPIPTPEATDLTAAHAQEDTPSERSGSRVSMTTPEMPEADVIAAVVEDTTVAEECDVGVTGEELEEMENGKDKKIGDIQNGEEEEDADENGSVIETESVCSLEETAAKIESALRKNLHLDDVNGYEKDTEPEMPDPTKLPGYQQVPDNCPKWKSAMIQKKNDQLLQEALRAIAEKQAEEDRWRDVPVWKKSLILDKEKRKEEETAPEMVERKRRDEEMRRIHAMPPWKRDLLLKKRPDT